MQEDDFGDGSIKILKFVEVNEFDNMRKQKSEFSNEEKEQLKLKLEKKEEQKTNVEQMIAVEKSIEDLEKSDRSSNISVNEELRTLKDFKALISEKKVPKSIIVLKRTIIALGIILIILTCNFIPIRL